jgi:hypothetical protein
MVSYLWTFSLFVSKGHLPSQLVAIVEPLATSSLDPILDGLGVPDLLHQGIAVPGIGRDADLYIK